MMKAGPMGIPSRPRVLQNDPIRAYHAKTESRGIYSGGERPLIWWSPPPPILLLASPPPLLHPPPRRLRKDFGDCRVQPPIRAQKAAAGG